GGTITQPGGSIVTAGGTLLTNAAATALDRATNDFTVVAGTVTGALTLADANAVNTGTVTPTGVFAGPFTAATGITAPSTTVTGGWLHVRPGHHLTRAAAAGAH